MQQRMHVRLEDPERGWRTVLTYVYARLDRASSRWGCGIVALRSFRTCVIRKGPGFNSPLLQIPFFLMGAGIWLGAEQLLRMWACWIV